MKHIKNLLAFWPFALLAVFVAAFLVQVGVPAFDMSLDMLLAVVFVGLAVGLLFGAGGAIVNAMGLVSCAAPMRSTDFRAVVEPILNDCFDGVYDQRKDEYKQVFTVTDGIARAYHEEVMLYGFNAAPQLPDGMPVTYQQGGVLFTRRSVYSVYGLAFALTKVLVEDGDHIRIGKAYSEHLAQSLIETKETLAANILNRAFNGSYTGGDGVCLSSNAHPIIGGTYSNILATAAALSQTSLEQALIQVRKAVDANGKKIRINPKKLVISPDNMFQAEVLLKSVLRAGTANNDINPTRGMLDNEPAVMSRLTSATAWWIQTDAPKGLMMYERRAMEKGAEGDFETDSMRYKATERYVPDFVSPLCLFGTPGA